MPEQIGKAGEKGDWLKIELLAPEAMIDALTNFLTEIGAQGAFQESLEPQSSNGFPEPSDRESLKAFLPVDVRRENRLAALTTYIDSLAELFPELEKPTFRTEVIHDPDWGEAWKKYFKPLRVSRNLVIKPTWERFAPTGRDIVIEIDPGMAFGTGQHTSTRMCLDAIEEILLRDRTFDKWHVLDVGTGTGILGIACAKLDAERVLCVDIDQKATEIAGENVLINQVEDRVEIANRDVATVSESFELIVANLTAKILIKLRPVLLRLIAPGGYIVISGIIEGNRSDIEARFLDDSLALHRLITEKEWVCYVLKKGSGRPVTIPRIYLPRPLEVGDACAAAEDQTRYITSVLRMREGDTLIVFNGSDWEFDAVLRHTQAGALSLEITNKRPVPLDEVEITLCQAIPKMEKMDGIIRHATELGARRIIPFLAARSIPRWPEAKGPQKRERWRKIAIEAARQCGRIDVPEIGEISSFAEMLGDLQNGTLRLIPWEEEAGRGIREVLRDPRYGGTKGFEMVIGPEGGFARDEIDRARQAGFLPVSLGRRVLRVETAALAVLAILQYERGAIGGADTGNPL